MLGELACSGDCYGGEEDPLMLGIRSCVQASEAKRFCLDNQGMARSLSLSKLLLNINVSFMFISMNEKRIHLFFFFKDLIVVEYRLH